MTTSDLKQARAVLEEWAAGRGGRVPARVRREVLAAVEAAHDSGLSYDRIAEALGISSKLLGRWRLRERRLRTKSPAQSATPEAKFAAVRLSLAATEFVVHGPCGVRVEGMTIESLAELCRRLA